MQPCPVRPSGPGPLAEVVRWMEREIRALQPIPAPGELVSTGPRGVVRRPLNAGGAGGGGGAPLKRLFIVNVLEDTLECSDEGDFTVTHTVFKPWHLRVGSYAAYDGGVLTAFEDSNTWPGGAAGNMGEYTLPYLMRANDGGLLDSPRAVQQRYQLRFSSPLFALPPAPKQREYIHEAVWPPYYALDTGTGGAPGGYNGGGYDSYPTDSQMILAAQDNLGQWHEVLPARQWVDV